MNPHPIQLCDDTDCEPLDAFLAARIVEFNANATGYADGRLLGGRVHDDAGAVVAGFSGHTWGGCCVLTHLWVHESHRRSGLGSALLQAVEAEAVRRGCGQVVLATHSFQAPGFYERRGYRMQAEILNNPRGHADVVYTKQLARCDEE